MGDHSKYGRLMQRTVDAQRERLGSGRRRKEHSKVVAGRAVVGLVLAACVMAAVPFLEDVPSLAFTGGAVLGGLLLGDAITRLPDSRISVALHRFLPVAQRVLLVVLVLIAAVFAVAAGFLLGWVMSRSPSGPGGSWGVTAGALALVAAGVVVLAASSEPMLFSVWHRRWMERVGDAASVVLGTATVIGLTAVAWHVTDAVGALTAMCAVALAQLGWLITAQLQRSRTVADLAATTSALASAAARQSDNTDVVPDLASLLDLLLELEVIVKRRDWRLPLSSRPRQLFDGEVHAMIQALVAVSLPTGFSVSPTTLARRLQGEVQAMSDTERVAEIALFAADLRHLSTGSRPWLRDQPGREGPAPAGVH